MNERYGPLEIRRSGPFEEKTTQEARLNCNHDLKVV